MERHLEQPRLYKRHGIQRNLDISSSRQFLTRIPWILDKRYEKSK